MAKVQLDPRTKLALLILVATFVLGGAGGKKMQMIVYLLSVVPIILLFISKHLKRALVGGSLVVCAYLMQTLVVGNVHGTLGFLLLLIIGVWTRVLPGVLMGQYVVETTKVSEFIAALERMHIPEQLTIPLSVMFRFFPTVAEEIRSINAAMRMRDIRWGRNKLIKEVEYRFVPMLNCSAKIGEELSASALSRGLGGDNKRTNICSIGFGCLDYIALVFCVVCIVYGVVSSMGVIG